MNWRESVHFFLGGDEKLLYSWKLLYKIYLNFVPQKITIYLNYQFIMEK